MAGRRPRSLQGRKSKEQIVKESKGFEPVTLGSLRTRDLLGTDCSSACKGVDLDPDLHLGRDSSVIEGLNYVNVISDEKRRLRPRTQTPKTERAQRSPDRFSSSSSASANEE
eukprot:Gb_41252 [translate_table: standard]